MTFRNREKKRLVPLKSDLFSAEACQLGSYKRKRYDFCLRNDCAHENLHASIRDEALEYFKNRAIRWHDGRNDGPSNHLCCSQSFCVNTWFPFRDAPGPLMEVLRGLGYDIAEMLPFELDEVPPNDPGLYVAFEWVGEQNYLKERTGGWIASNEGRTRGQNFTSLDFAFRFRRSDGLVQIVGGEWKYTEEYTEKNVRFSAKGTDRLDIYGPSLDSSGCQIMLEDLPNEVLFYDPFDQLMRQQLLCSAMERHREMQADVVSLLHAVPAANRGFVDRVTSPKLRTKGSSIHDIWSKLVKHRRFKGVHVEELLPLVCQFAPGPEWAAYMTRRYGRTY